MVQVVGKNSGVTTLGRVLISHDNEVWDSGIGGLLGGEEQLGSLSTEVDNVVIILISVGLEKKLTKPLFRLGLIFILLELNLWLVPSNQLVFVPGGKAISCPRSLS